MPRFVFLLLAITLFHTLADMEAVEMLWQMRAQRRQTNPDLPDTVTRLTTPEGSVVYLVGTAHFSDSSKNDVTTVSVLKPLEK